MDILEWKRGAKLQISEHFTSCEFECPCGKCEKQFISRTLVSKLEHVRHEAKQPIHINSGYRCEEHNKAVGGHSSSSHVYGLAADIRPSNFDVNDLDNLYKICYDEFDNIGNGINKGFIHVDTRAKKATGKRLWSY